MPTNTPRGYPKPIGADNATTAIKTSLSGALDLIDADMTVALRGGNPLTNPGFEIWQRGVGPFTVNNAYTADRWQMQLGGTSTLSVSREGTIVDAGSAYSLAAVYTHNAQSGIVQNLEHYAAFKGLTLTHSMRVRTSTANAVRIAIWDSVNGFRYSAYHSGSGAFETLTITAAIGAAATGVQCSVAFSVSCTAYLDNATLVVGSVALPYTPLHPSEEWARCLRYYEVHGGAVAARHPIIEAVATAASQSFSEGVSFAAIKAVVPTMTKNGTFSVVNMGQPTAAGATISGYRFSATSIASGAVYTAPGAADNTIVAEANP